MMGTAAETPQRWPRGAGPMSTSAYSPIAPVRLYEGVVRQILGLIASGEVTPGSRLPPERDLAEQFHVSRNVLREAFRVLEVRGIVESRPGGGRRVRAANIPATLPAEGIILRLEDSVIRDILESRELIEVQVARLAAARGDDEARARLLAESRSAGLGWEQNVRFHTAVAEACGNFMLERLVRLQMDLLRDAHQRAHYESPGRAAELLRQHRLIAEAIASQDPLAAEDAVRQHFTATRAALSSEPPAEDKPVAD